MPESVTGETRYSDSYFVFLQFVLMIVELFLMFFVFVYPCEKFASLVGVKDIRFDSVRSLVALRVTGRGAGINRNFRCNRLFVFDVMFVFTVIRALKPYIKVVIRCVNFYILEFNCILALFRNKGLMFICLAPNCYQTVLPVGDIKGNNYIVLCFLTSHLLGFNFNIVYYRSKGSLVWDVVQCAVFCFVRPNTIFVLLSVSRKSFYFDRHIALFYLCARIWIGNFYRSSAIDARIEL